MTALVIGHLAAFADGRFPAVGALLAFECSLTMLDWVRLVMFSSCCLRPTIPVKYFSIAPVSATSEGLA